MLLKNKGAWDPFLSYLLHTHTQTIFLQEDFSDDDSNIKMLELGFLSADYESLQNVAAGLLAICRNLGKVSYKY